MGIKEFWPLVKPLARRPESVLDFLHTGRLAPDCVVADRPLRVGIDVPILLTRRWMSSPSMDVVSGIVQQHLQIMACDRAPASIVYVFDGEHNPLKSHERARRAASRKATADNFRARQDLHDAIQEQQQQQQVTELPAVIMEMVQSNSAVRKLVEEHTAVEVCETTGVPQIKTDFVAVARAIRQKHKLDNDEETPAANERKPPPEIYHELMRQFDAHGISYMISNDEAEHLVAKLSQHGLIDVGITDDSDAFPFGMTCVLRNFDPLDQFATGNQVFFLADVLKHLKLTREQLVDACILIGCDFTEGRSGLPGIGPKHAIPLVQQHNNIETILETPKGVIAMHKYQQQVPPGTPFSYKAARAMFMDNQLTECQTYGLLSSAACTQTSPVSAGPQ